MVFFGVFSEKLYYGSADSYHVLSSFPSRTRWHRPFFPIRVYTPSKTRLKVGSVHALYQWCVLWRALKVSVVQRLAMSIGERVVVGSTPRVGCAMLERYVRVS